MQTDPIPVSALVALLKETVEENFIRVAVEGEVSNFAQPASGHLYMTLKDEKSQLRAAMFRGRARLLKFRPENGMQVICRGSVTIYPQRGELQLVIEEIEPVGAGGLQVAFEQLKKKLEAEGLFAAERKREIPAHPERIGVVTSATGAAVHDIIRVLQRRGAGVEVLLHPVRVQGEGAAEEIAAAIENLNRAGHLDVLIVGRGGGSMEDLWAFNEEAVARAIAASQIPVVSAVGHEVDYTIADFVADLRAATPSAAAEIVARSRMELENHLDQLRFRLAAQMQSRIEVGREIVSGLQKRLVSPTRQLELRRLRVIQAHQRLVSSCRVLLMQQRNRLASCGEKLDLLSPLQTLQRGYAIARKGAGGVIVRRSSELSPGDRLDIRFGEGAATAVVEDCD